MALPRMKAIEFGAAPQRAEPASKKSMDARKVALMLKNAYSFPNTSWKAQLVSRYAVAYQPISLGEWNSLVIWGMAVEMMRRSCNSGLVSFAAPAHRVETARVEEPAPLYLEGGRVDAHQGY